MAEPSLRQRYGYLPAVLVHVLEAAGEDAMLRLVAFHGGTRVAVTREPSADHPLALAVGLEAALAIHARLRANHVKHIDVPLMTRTIERQRRRRILTLRQEHTKVADIARAIGMTERGVYMALAKAREEPSDDYQMTLPL